MLLLQVSWSTYRDGEPLSTNKELLDVINDLEILEEEILEVYLKHGVDVAQFMEEDEDVIKPLPLVIPVVDKEVNGGNGDIKEGDGVVLEGDGLIDEDVHSDNEIDLDETDLSVFDNGSDDNEDIFVIVVGLDLHNEVRGWMIIMMITLHLIIKEKEW